MKIVIQCAASKNKNAGTMKNSDGLPVLFVARPDLAPPSVNHVYARPDDLAADGRSWRDLLLDYNAKPDGNPLGLFPAWQLYRHEVYGKLVARYGLDKVFILSAGWGLIRSDFLTPVYDITFSAQAEGYKRRRARDVYCDLNMLDNRADEPVAFFGGKDYLPLFCRLSANYMGQRIAVFNSKREPQEEGVRFVPYHTRTRTNWHYEAVNAFLEGAFFSA